MLLLEFCNIRKWTVDALRNLYMKYEIVHTKAGQMREWELFCFTWHVDGRFYFSSKDKEDELGKGSVYFDNFWTPTDQQFNDLWPSLEASQEEFRTFLNQGLNGQLDLVAYLNDILKRLPDGVVLRFAESDKKLIPSMQYTGGILHDLESRLEWEILSIFLSNAGDQFFGRLRICQHCGAYFTYSRSNQKWCSPTCRRTNWNREKAKQGYFREYMSKEGVRRKGHYIKAKDRRKET